MTTGALTRLTRSLLSASRGGAKEDAPQGWAYVELHHVPPAF